MRQKFGVLTVSDRSAAGEREDRSGPALVEKIKSIGWDVEFLGVVPDDVPSIREGLKNASDSGRYAVILTSGGTGFAARDVTPEATGDVIERAAPGISEILRAESYRITPHAALSRGISGIRKQTLIINLPGSPKAALENLQILIPILPHAVDLLVGDQQAEDGHQLPGHS